MTFMFVSYTQRKCGDGFKTFSLRLRRGAKLVTAQKVSPCLEGGWVQKVSDPHVVHDVASQFQQAHERLASSD